MVVRVQYLLVDDIDGSPAVETLKFRVGDMCYELELSEAHLREFHDSMEQWTKHARIVEEEPSTSLLDEVIGRRQDGPAIRRWAELRGIPVAARGRIPAALRQQYYAERVGPTKERA